jgi:hypothetical protein
MDTNVLGQAEKTTTDDTNVRNDEARVTNDKIVSVHGSRTLGVWRCFEVVFLMLI